MKNSFLTGLLILVISSTACTNNKAIYGGIGGAAAGAGVGAIVGKVSHSTSVPKAMAIGAGAGVPVGIATVYATSATINYVELAGNDSSINENNKAIYENYRALQIERDELLQIEDRETLRDEDFDYKYMGQKLGNAWR